MAGGNQTAGIPQNLTAGRAQGYGMSPGMGAQNYGSPYASSGLGRFTSIGAYNPAPYTPQVYRPSLLTIPNSGPYTPPPGPAPNGSLVGPDGSGPGTEGVGNSGPSTNPAASAAVVGAIASGLLGPAIGVPLGNAVGGLGVVGPGDDANTNVSSVNAVNGMDAASDAAANAEGGSANAAPSGVSANADGSPAGTAVGGEAGDGSGGGGGGGK